MSTRSRLELVGHGLWLLVPGLWLGLFPGHYRRVHEIERDYWIERVHAMWLSLVGAVIAFGGLRGREATETRLLAMVSATGMATADISAGRKTGLARIYYLDLVGEVFFGALAARRLAVRVAKPGRG